MLKNLNEQDRRFIKDRRDKKLSEDKRKALGLFIKHLVLGKVIKVDDDFDLELLDDFYKIPHVLNPFQSRSIYLEFVGSQGAVCGEYVDILGKLLESDSSFWVKLIIQENMKTMTKSKGAMKKDEDKEFTIPSEVSVILEDIYFNKILPLVYLDINNQDLTEEEERLIESRKLDSKIKNDLKKQKAAGSVNTVKDAIVIIRKYGKRIN